MKISTKALLIVETYRTVGLPQSERADISKADSWFPLLAVISSMIMIVGVIIGAFHFALGFVITLVLALLPWIIYLPIPILAALCSKKLRKIILIRSLEKQVTTLESYAQSMSQATGNFTAQLQNTAMACDLLAEISSGVYTALPISPLDESLLSSMAERAEKARMQIDSVWNARFKSEQELRDATASALLRLASLNNPDLSRLPNQLESTFEQMEKAEAAKKLEKRSSG